MHPFTSDPPLPGPGPGPLWSWWVCAEITFYPAKAFAIQQVVASGPPARLGVSRGGKMCCPPVCAPASLAPM